MSEVNGWQQGGTMESYEVTATAPARPGGRIQIKGDGGPGFYAKR